MGRCMIGFLCQAQRIFRRRAYEPRVMLPGQYLHWSGQLPEACPHTFDKDWQRRYHLARYRPSFFYQRFITAISDEEQRSQSCRAVTRGVRYRSRGASRDKRHTRLQAYQAPVSITFTRGRSHSMLLLPSTSLASRLTVSLIEGKFSPLQLD